MKLVLIISQLFFLLAFIFNFSLWQWMAKISSWFRLNPWFFCGHAVTVFDLGESANSKVREDKPIFIFFLMIFLFVVISFLKIKKNAQGDMSQDVDNWWYYSNRRSTVVIVSNSIGCCSTSLKKTISARGHLNRHKSHDVRSHQPGMLSGGEIICHHKNLLWKSSVLWNLVRYKSSGTFDSMTT